MSNPKFYFFEVQSDKKHHKVSNILSLFTQPLFETSLPLALRIEIDSLELEKEGFEEFKSEEFWRFFRVKAP